MITIVLTPDYRITSDGIQFILQHRRMVDPTKAPNWSKRAAEGADPSPYEKWVDNGFYPLNLHGLAAAVTKVACKTVAMSESENLRDFNALLLQQYESMQEAIKAQIPREFYGRIEGERQRSGDDASTEEEEFMCPL